jgi:hypothetical protein
MGVLELSGIMGLILLFAVIYAVIQVLTSNIDNGPKALWVAGILFFPFLGVLAWFFFGPETPKGKSPLL